MFFGKPGLDDIYNNIFLVNDYFKDKSLGWQLEGQGSTAPLHPCRSAPALSPWHVKDAETP